MRKLDGIERVPAVEEVELDRHPVLAVPARVAERGRVGEQVHPVGRDVVDVLLDDDLEQDHRQDVARGLEQALVVPAVGALEQPGDPIVLAQEEHAHEHEAELEVPGIAAEREELAPLRVGDLLVAHHGDAVEALAAVLVEVRRELLAADRLRLQPPALVRAQLVGDARVEPVDLDEIDLVVGLVARGVADELAGRGVAVRALTAQEAVDEPLREVGEQDGRLLGTASSRHRA